MAAINFDDYGGESDSGTLQLIINWAGAFLSVLLIVGLATWGWKLWQRDVTGVPGGARAGRPDARDTR